MDNFKGKDLLSFIKELIKASVYDATFLKEMNSQLADCVMIGDKELLIIFYSIKSV